MEGNEGTPVKKRRWGRMFVFGLLLALLGGVCAGSYGYYSLQMDNIALPSGETHVLLIPSGADYTFVKNELTAAGVIKNMSTFEMTVSALKYDQYVKPGRYEIAGGMNNLELVRKLRSGDQDAIKFRFLTYRQPSDLAASVAEQFEWEAQALLDLMEDPEYLSRFDLSVQNVMELFLPDTYFLYYTTTPEKLMERMHEEYKKFWDESRLAKAEKLAMTPHEVITLASIVQAESYMADERPTIAGVYINRLKRGIPLQADPTVIYAVGDFSIKRVLKRHLEHESPYNTYLHAGLPPGPINNPEVSSIDAVLNYQVHDYIYFCAKPDFSGYHNFAKTLSQHNRNANAYHAAIQRLERDKRKKNK